MKLLFDENVSPRLVQRLAADRPGNVGNTGTMLITELLRRERQRVKAFEQHPEASLLILSLGAGAI